MDTKWLSTKQAADHIGIQPRTLYAMIDRGELPAYRFGRVIRLKFEDVDHYIDGAQIQPGTLGHLHGADSNGSSE